MIGFPRLIPRTAETTLTQQTTALRQRLETAQAAHEHLAGELAVARLAVARLAADPDNQRAEFAVTVRSDLKGHGIGRLVMQRLITYARQRGIGEVFGMVG